MSIGSCHSAPDTDTDAFDIFWFWIILSPFAVLFRFGSLNCCQTPFLSNIWKFSHSKSNSFHLLESLTWFTWQRFCLWPAPSWCFASSVSLWWALYRGEMNGTIDLYRVQSDHRSFGSGWDGVSKIQSWRCSSSATAFWILNVRNHVRMISCSFKAPPL